MAQAGPTSIAVFSVQTGEYTNLIQETSWFFMTHNHYSKNEVLSKILIPKANPPIDPEVAACKALWEMGPFSRVGAQKSAF